ncbi:MAG: pilus assembly protein [Acidobacteria bacterium]|nr:pilus assembly protein [Acidobacteriota bacterium]
MGCSRRERGSATVELAAVLPVAAIAMLLVVQVGLVVGAQLVVLHAAREGAREAAVSNDASRAREAALRAGRLDAERAEVLVSPDERHVGTPVSVTVRYRVPIAVPFLARFVADDLRLSATVTMRTEREEPAGG